MTIIDLDAARAARAADLQAAREMTDAAVASIAALAEGYATLAFSVSGPVRLANEQLAVDVNRSQLRRVIAIVRTATRQAVPEVRQQFRDLAGQAFAVRLDHLIREHDRQRGAAPAFEVIGGLWVSAGRKPYEAKPWPCVLTLGRSGALAWMEHIETTPYAMTPATQAKFDEARKGLQDPTSWPTPAAEAVVDRIIRTCWERGWRPEERATA